MSTEPIPVIVSDSILRIRAVNEMIKAGVHLDYYSAHRGPVEIKSVEFYDSNRYWVKDEKGNGLLIPVEEPIILVMANNAREWTAITTKLAEISS